MNRWAQSGGAAYIGDVSRDVWIAVDNMKFLQRAQSIACNDCFPEHLATRMFAERDAQIAT